MPASPSPAVAVVTAAVDDRGSYLRALHRSVAAAMHAAHVSSWEWVIQIDGPHPQTIHDIVATWNDPRIHSHAMGRHGGPATTRTAALARILASPGLVAVGL